MDAGGKQELPVWGGFHAMACSWELQVLDQLDLSPAPMPRLTVCCIDQACKRCVLACFHAKRCGMTLL